MPRVALIVLFGFVALRFAAAAQSAESQQDSLGEKSRVARQALTSGQYERAAELYRELAKALPDNPGLRLNLAIALAKAGHTAAVIPEAEQVTRANPSSAPAWLLLGLAYQQLNQPRKAIAPLREAVRLNPTDRSALLELGDAELTTGDARRAADDFGKLAALQPDLPKAWEGLGRANLSLSEAAFERLRTGHSDSAFYLALLARSHAAEERYAEALSLYAAALQLAPDTPGLHAARAEIYRATQHEDWAQIEDQREAQVPKRDCAQHPVECAYLSENWRRTVELAETSRSAENLYWSALACSHLAEESFGKLAALPPSPAIHAILADAYQREGRRLDAIAEWRKALDFNPSDHLVRGRLGESMLRARQYPEAEHILSALVAEQPENGEWQYLLGDVLLQMKRDEEALPHLAAATKLLPELLTAQEALGRLYLELNEPDKALEPLERARPLDDGSISFALSSVYRKLGRQEDARAALVRYQALSKQKGSATIPTETEIAPP